ncbi:hypothetical protein AB0M43_14375 [Longispora sp. NPDC051575]|uniref:hypothetical protein n=1 Tax=Longispora sp. NPDC051575 TaxID=3154943 RepID=UPI0034420093
MAAGRLGMICTPAGGGSPRPGVRWCADNAVFVDGYPGDAKYLAWLRRLAQRADPNLAAFATAPDVVCRAAETLARSEPMLDPIRAAGYPVALVAQDGLEDLDVPWTGIDALFLGGSTDWKLGPAAAHLAAEARSRGLWVHMGRVNSHRRLAHADHIGCHSADGTYLRFGPDLNLPNLLHWLDQLEPEQHVDPPPESKMPTRPTPSTPTAHQKVAAFAAAVVERSTRGYDLQPADWASAAEPTDIPDLDDILTAAPRIAAHPGTSRVGRTFRGVPLVVVLSGPGFTIAFRPQPSGAAPILLGTDTDGPVCLNPGQRADDIAAAQQAVLRVLSIPASR